MAQDDGAPVQLHVYDLSQGLARSLSPMLLGKVIEGVWHTGLVCFGREWYFSGGIQAGVPGGTHFGPPLHVLDLGRTHVPEELFKEYLEDISPRFTAATYNLLSHNCNNFSEEVAQFLVGKGIPPHITGLPADVLSTPFGQQLLPMLQGNLGLGSITESTTPAFVQDVAPTVPTPVPTPAPARAARTPTKEEQEAATKKAIEAEFAALMSDPSQKLTPNEAAALAVKRVSARSGS